MLYFYTEPNDTAAISKDTLLTPFTVTFDGRVGGCIDKRLYVRNDESNKWYSNIVVSAYDFDTTENWVDGTKTGFYWKFSTNEIVPSSEEWELIGNNVSISLGNIGDSLFGDISSYLSFWVRVTVPGNIQIAVRKTIVLQISATENLI